MVPTPRTILRTSFSSSDTATLVGYMDQLARAGDGWINLLAKTEANKERSTSLRFMTMFSGGGIGIAMGTWTPARPGRRSPVPATLGITHNAGRRVATADSPLSVPAHWIVEQDHRRRGLVVDLPAGEPHDQVLQWALRAVAMLSPEPVTEWIADVYLPSTSKPPIAAPPARALRAGRPRLPPADPPPGPT